MLLLRHCVLFFLILKVQYIGIFKNLFIFWLCTGADMFSILGRETPSILKILIFLWVVDPTKKIEEHPWRLFSTHPWVKPGFMNNFQGFLTLSSSFCGLSILPDLLLLLHSMLLWTARWVNTTNHKFSIFFRSEALFLYKWLNQFAIL